MARLFLLCITAALAGKLKQPLAVFDKSSGKVVVDTSALDADMKKGAKDIAEYSKDVAAELKGVGMDSPATALPTSLLQTDKKAAAADKKFGAQNAAEYELVGQSYADMNRVQATITDAAEKELAELKQLPTVEQATFHWDPTLFGSPGPAQPSSFVQKGDVIGGVDFSKLDALSARVGSIESHLHGDVQDLAAKEQRDQAFADKLADSARASLLQSDYTNPEVQQAIHAAKMYGGKNWKYNELTRLNDEVQSGQEKVEGVSPKEIHQAEHPFDFGLGRKVEGHAMDPDEIMEELEKHPAAKEALDIKADRMLSSVEIDPDLQAEEDADVAAHKEYRKEHPEQISMMEVTNSRMRQVAKKLLALEHHLDVGARRSHKHASLDRKFGDLHEMAQRARSLLEQVMKSGAAPAKATLDKLKGQMRTLKEHVHAELHHHLHHAKKVHAKGISLMQEHKGVPGYDAIASNLDSLHSRIQHQIKSLAKKAEDTAAQRVGQFDEVSTAAPAQYQYSFDSQNPASWLEADDHMRKQD